MKYDPTFRAFLDRQAEERGALSQASDILELEDLPTGAAAGARTRGVSPSTVGY
jgi:hypothetical protein